MITEMTDIKTIAKNWRVTPRRIAQLCKSGKIEGATKIGGQWKIPLRAAQPDTLRNKTPQAHSTTRQLPCPVGITSYKEVSSECYYVDKTLLIKDLIDDHNKVTLFTRPRRFGKTLNMDMLKTFFEKTEEDSSIYFSGRTIWSCNDAYKAYQGSYPVIFLSFKDAHHKTWSDMYEGLTITLKNEFKRHADILKSDQLAESDKKFFRRMLEGAISSVECQSSVGLLSHMLHDAWKSKVVVIVDEYDTPIQQGYSNGYYDQVIDFIRNLFSAVFKDNEDLEFGILTGILRIAKESLFSGLNNLVVNTILDEKYSEYFGFTPSEVKEMAEYYERTDKLAELADWYDGYVFGRTEVYNPWSVISYFNNDCKPKAFWSRTSSNDIIIGNMKNGEIELQKTLLQLMENQPARAVIDSDIIYPEIGSSEDSLFSFLLMTGYLKISSVITTLDDNPICNLLIPNREIKAVFKREILDRISETVPSSVIRNFQLALKTNDTKALQETLSSYLLRSASCFDTAGENFYHGMMLGLLAILADDYKILSNRESGDGRFDIQLSPYSELMPGILMEFKAARNADEKSLAELAAKAVQQIQEKQYAAEMLADGIAQIQIYGIAFCSKKATVSSLVVTP